MKITHIEPMLIALPYDHGAPKPTRSTGKTRTLMDAHAMREFYFCDLGASPTGDAISSEDGFMTVPQGPGLGVDVNERVIEQYRIG